MIASKTTHCKHGHKRTEETIYINSRGNVQCKVCIKASRLRYIAKNQTQGSFSRPQYQIDYRFGGNRETAIQRDGEKCVMCGMSRDEHRAKWGSDITVDHIDGTGKNTPKHLKNNSLDNLQTLCLSCHGKKDGLRRTQIHGIRHRLAKLTDEDVRDIRMFLKSGFGYTQISRVYPVAPNTIAKIAEGFTWVHVK